MKRFFFIIMLGAFAFAASAQTASRLVSFARYFNDSTLSPRDTGGYIYSGGNGGQITAYTNVTLNADYPIRLFHNVDYVTNLDGLTQFDTAWARFTPTIYHGFKQVFDGDNNIVSTIDGSQLRQLDSFDHDHHLLQRTIGSLISAGTWSQDSRYYYNYDGLGRLLESIQQRGTATGLVNTYRSLYSYDSYGQIYTIEGYEWDTTATDWTHTTSRRYYYTSGKPDSIILDNYSLGGVNTRAVYYFSPANDTMIVNYDYTFSDYLRIINTYNSGHLKVSSTVYWLDHSAQSYRTDWTYNSYNQVTASRTYYQDTSGNWIFGNLFKFYYELYTSGVVPIGMAKGDLQVYPVPAQEMVMVKMDWQDPVPFSVNVCDMQGRVLRSWNELPTSNYQKTIPLAGMAPGCYVLRILSEKENVAKQFMKE